MDLNSPTVPGRSSTRGGDTKQLHPAQGWHGTRAWFSLNWGEDAGVRRDAAIENGTRKKQKTPWGKR